MFRELHDYHLPLLEAANGESLHRRHHAGPIDLAYADLDGYLQLVGQLGRLPVSLDADRLSSTARWLIDHHPDRRTAAPCIRVRMCAATALRVMLAEPGWEPAPSLATAICRLVAHLREEPPLIPRALPVIGHLDDAILVDALWPQIEGELRDYIAFRYLRRIEAELGRTTPARLAFTRRDWEQEWPALQGL